MLLMTKVGESCSYRQNEDSLQAVTFRPNARLASKIPWMISYIRIKYIVGLQADR